MEFALVAVFFSFLLMFAVFDVGRALYSYDLVAHAARVGTRFAIVHAAPCAGGATTSCELATKNFILANVPGIDASKLQTPVFVWEASSPTCAGVARPGCTVKITITYNFTYLTMPSAAPTIASSSQMVIAQ